MPKATSITKEMIVSAAFDIVQVEGFQSLSARGIAKHIGCSTQPIYWIYENMDVLKQDVIVKIVAYLNGKINSFHKTNHPFLNFGMGLIHTAYSESKLFKLIYVDNILNLNFADITPGEEMLNVMKTDEYLANIPDDKLYDVAVVCWIFAQGLACLHATGMMAYDEEKIEKMLVDFLHIIQKSQ